MLLLKTDLSAQIFQKPSINNRSKLKLYLLFFFMKIKVVSSDK